MYLFRIFRSFLPIHNPIGFGASDFVVLALAVLLVALLLAISFVAPYVRQISKRTRVCMCLLFVLAIALRLALLPQSPVPIPSGADDFGYLLLGDTLSHLRLANPTHPMHEFFEAVFVLQQPAYASIYPLGQGIFLAIGRLVLQSFWAGVLLSSAAFCALCYWMLRAWVAPIWALAGGLLAVIEFGPLNPWVNSYWGGSVSACAGCLVFGSLPRLRESPRTIYGVFLEAGLGLQIVTRPFEAVFLALAAPVYLLFMFRRDWLVALKPVLAASAVAAAALGLTLLQNKAVTHSFLTMPYMLSRYQYGVPATMTLQPNAVPHRPMTAEQELDYKAQAAIHGPEQIALPLISTAWLTVSVSCDSSCCRLCTSPSWRSSQVSGNGVTPGPRGPFCSLPWVQTSIRFSIRSTLRPSHPYSSSLPFRDCKNWGLRREITSPRSVAPRLFSGTGFIFQAITICFL